MVLVLQDNTRAAAKAQLTPLKCPDRKDFGSTYQQSFWGVKVPRYEPYEGQQPTDPGRLLIDNPAAMVATAAPYGPAGAPVGSQAGRAPNHRRMLRPCRRDAAPSPCCPACPGGETHCPQPSQQTGIDETMKACRSLTCSPLSAPPS